MYGVKRVFYTINVVLDRKDEFSNSWTLLFRFNPLEVTHTKRDGNLILKNYFSGGWLRAIPDGDGLEHHLHLPQHEQQQAYDNENKKETTNVIQQERPTVKWSPKLAVHVSDNSYKEDGGGFFCSVGQDNRFHNPEIILFLTRSTFVVASRRHASGSVCD